jgi:hypothetical protein
MPIKLRRGLKANRPEKTERNFPLTIEHVRRMYKVANLRDKVILSMATDLGWRIGDFKNIQIIDLPNLEQESPISFERKTQKCRIIAYGFISAESVDVLRLYLKELEDRKNRHAKANPYLFPSKGNRHANHHLSDEAFSKILKRLIRQARIDTNGKKVTFHCFRKMLLSAAINSGVGLVVGKKLIGKKIGFSDDTYLTDLALRQKFIQLKKFLTIRQTAKPENEGDIENLKFVVTKLHEDLTRERTITKAVTEKNMKITRDIEEMKKQIAEFQAFTEFLRSLGITNDSIAKLALEKMHKEE